MTEPLTTTELGLEVPLREAEEYREHTAARWKERDRESYDFALYLVRELGLTNKVRIETLVSEHRKARQLPGISRNSVIALMNSAEFKAGEIEEIIKRRSLLTTADALDKIEQLLEKAQGAKDLGAAAMALTAVYNVKQLSNGAATRITGKPEGDTGKSFDRYLERARKRLEEKHGKIIDVTPAQPVAEMVTIESKENGQSAGTAD